MPIHSSNFEPSYSQLNTNYFLLLMLCTCTSIKNDIHHTGGQPSTAVPEDHPTTLPLTTTTNPHPLTTAENDITSPLGESTNGTNTGIESTEESAIVHTSGPLDGERGATATVHAPGLLDRERGATVHTPGLFDRDTNYNKSTAALEERDNTTLAAEKQNRTLQLREIVAWMLVVLSVIIVAVVLMVNNVLLHILRKLRKTKANKTKAREIEMKINPFYEVVKTKDLKMNSNPSYKASNVKSHNIEELNEVV